MQTKIVDSQLITKNGWRQGAFLLIPEPPQKIFQQLGLKENKLYVLLSQDCDILNASLQKEPVVELLQADKIETLNLELCDGKNPRQLHLKAKIFNESEGLEFFPNSRFFLPREYLQELIPFNCVLDSTRELRLLISWIVKRYKRPGFPDQFNLRTNIKKKQVRDILNQEAKKSLGLFIRLQTDQELSENENYNLIVIMLVRKEMYEVSSELSEIEEGFEKILKHLFEIKGIKILEGSQVLSTDDISLHRYEELRKWDFDDISFSGEENGDILSVA